MNYEIRMLKESLINTLNSHNLPIEVKRLVLSELLILVTEASNKAIAEQKEEVKEDDKSGGQS